MLAENAYSVAVYSHVVGTTAHEQIAKINDLFTKGDEASPKSKPSIQERIAKSQAQAKEKASDKPIPDKSQKRKDPEL
jgi:hypothetical protein